MKAILLLLFILVNSETLNYYIYQPSDILEYINQFTLDEEDYEYIRDCLPNIFNDTYAYNTLAKNPPQPGFDKNYYNKVNIQKELSEIKTKNQSLYSFYHEITKVTSRLKDGHLYTSFLGLQNLLKNFAFIMPIKFKIAEYKGETRIFGKNNIKKEYQEHFLKSEETFKTIEENEDIPIKSINGKNPFDYISDFGKNYIDFKSPHGNFPFKFKYLQSSHTLDAFPLTLEELTNFTIIYDNDQSFKTDFIIDSHIDLNPENIDNFKNNKLKDEEQLISMPFSLLDIKNTIKNFPEISEIITEENNTTFNNSIKWDYNYTDDFKCKADHDNKINIYYSSIFMGENYNINLFKNIILECSKLFDNNTYPIILINDLNLGGFPQLSHLLLETLSSRISSAKSYFYYKNTDFLQSFFSIFLDGGINANNCETMTGQELFENGTKIDYENIESELLSKPFLMYPNKKDREEIDLFKSSLKNKRKPTDIIAFTDGFSFSAASLILKYLQYYGGGITIGYFGHPNKTNIPYDSSLHPTAFLQEMIFDMILDRKGYSELKSKYGFQIQMPSLRSYYNPNDLSIPLEYTITPVDEIKPIYEFFNEGNYDKFISISKEIIEKYKTQCNPENKKLLLIDSECDKSFKNNYTHGGYECGSDGKWNKKKCVASYCDLGFIFDHIKKKCVVDFCSKMSEGRVIDDDDIEPVNPDDKKNDNGKRNMWLIIGGCALGLILIIIIAFLICRCRRKNQNENINQADDINIGLKEE